MWAAGVTEANDPDQFLGLRASFDLPNRIELDAMLRAVAALPNPVSARLRGTECPRRLG